MGKHGVLVGLVLAAAAVLIAGGAGYVAAQAPSRELPPLQLIQRIPVPGISGRIDHFTAYPQRRLLIFAALGNNTVEIVNTFDGRVVRTLKGLDEPQGVLYVPGFDKIFAANAGNRSVNVFDGKTYALRKTIPLGEDPDNVRWDEGSKRVFVGYGGDGTGAIAMIDPAAETHVGKDLKTGGGHPESFQLEKKGSRIFVNVPEDNGAVEVLDRKGGGRTTWHLNGAKANFPMALDEDDHRLIVVTRRPPLVIVLNSDTGKEVARVPAAAGADDVYYDQERKRIYAIGGGGFINVIQQDDPDHYRALANIPTAIGVRTGILLGNSLYVGVPAAGAEPAQIWNYAVPD